MNTSMGSILRGAFGLVRERPWAVLIWSLIYVAGVVAMGLLMLPLAASMQSPAPGTNATPDWAALQTLAGVGLLVFVGAMVLFSILFAAAQRAVLRPGQSSLAFLRIGMDEVRLFLLGVMFVILFYILLVVLIIAAIVVGGILALAAGPGVGAVLAVVVVLFCCWIAAWLMTRFSLSYPLTVLRGEFVVFESWSLTGGRFWSLFGAYFVIFVVYFLLATLMSLVTSGSYLLEMMQGGFTSEAMQAAAEHQRAEQMAGVSLPMILSWVLGGLLGGLSIALFGGAAATAARDLTGDVAGVAETFA